MTNVAVWIRSLCCPPTTPQLQPSELQAIAEAGDITVDDVAAILPSVAARMGITMDDVLEMVKTQIDDGTWETQR